MFELDEERANKCYEQLLRFLDFSSRSEKELKDKLFNKGYHANEVEFAIEKAKKYKFIDDEAFARSYILTYKNKTGRQKISYKLTNDCNVDQTIVNNLLEDLYPIEEELEVCKGFALKYISVQTKSNKEYKNKIGGHLFSKGFSYSIINKVISQLNISDDDNIN